MTRLQSSFDAARDCLSACSLEFKLAGDPAKGVIDGYASTFDGQPDTYNDVVAPGAFAASLVDHRKAGSMPAMLWGHDANRSVGRWTSMAEDHLGLRVQGQFNLDTPAGREAYQSVKAGDVSGLSIGFSHANREVREDGSRRILSARLHEVSLTAIPSDQRARVREVKHVTSPRDFEELLIAAGLPRGAQGCGGRFCSPWGRGGRG